MSAYEETFAPVSRPELVAELNALAEENPPWHWVDGLMEVLTGETHGRPSLFEDMALALSREPRATAHHFVELVADAVDDKMYWLGVDGDDDLAGLLPRVILDLFPMMMSRQPDFCADVHGIWRSRYDLRTHDRRHSFHLAVRLDYFMSAT